MKDNESILDTALKKAESEKNNIRQNLDSVSRDLNVERRNHNTFKRTSQSRWTSQPAVKDLAREFNTYGKRKWKLWEIDQAREQLMYKATKNYQDEYYTHVNIASTIDMRRGLNLYGYDNMVKIERGKRKRVKCLLPSTSSIPKAMTCAEKIMTETVPWELVDGSKENINGGFSFDIEKLFIHLIKSYGLEEKSKNGEVEIAITIDGAKLDSKVAHVSFGFKLTDKDYVCPIAEKNIFYELKNLQSDKWCYPVKTIFEKDNQETYEEHFENEFSFVRRVRAIGIPALGWKPFKIGEPQDTKDHQITLFRGGAAKLKTRFCHRGRKRDSL
jgi:hypothetical protein